MASLKDWMHNYPHFPVTWKHPDDKELFRDEAELQWVCEDWEALGERWEDMAKTCKAKKWKDKQRRLLHALAHLKLAGIEHVVVHTCGGAQNHCLRYEQKYIVEDLPHVLINVQVREKMTRYLGWTTGAELRAAPCVHVHATSKVRHRLLFVDQLHKGWPSEHQLELT